MDWRRAETGRTEQGVWSYAQERQYDGKAKYVRLARRLTRREVARVAPTLTPPRQIGTLDSHSRVHMDALEEAKAIGNERAGVVTDCSHCRKQLRGAAKFARDGAVLRCSTCQARWVKSGSQLRRL